MNPKKLLDTWIIRPDLVIGSSCVLLYEYENEISDRGLSSRKMVSEGASVEPPFNSWILKLSMTLWREIKERK